MRKGKKKINHDQYYYKDVAPRDWVRGQICCSSGTYCLKLAVSVSKCHPADRLSPYPGSFERGLERRKRGDGGTGWARRCFLPGITTMILFYVGFVWGFFGCCGCCLFGFFAGFCPPPFFFFFLNNLLCETLLRCFQTNTFSGVIAMGLRRRSLCL